MANILIVDDSMYMRKMISDIVTGAGHSVVGEAADGAEAVEKARDLKPDLITMDIIMPKVGDIEGGIDAVKGIAKELPDIKIVMVSAMGQQEFIIKAIDAGAKDFVVKPFDADKVTETIERVLKG